MSAGPSAPNPGSPKSPLGTPPGHPSLLRRFAGPLLLASLGLGLTYTFFVTRAPAPPGTPAPSPLRTPGVKNIENAYTNGGATATHTPAYGGTKQGGVRSRSQDAGLRDGAATGTQLPKNFQSESVGEDQRPGETTWFAGIWNNFKYGSEKGK